MVIGGIGLDETTKIKPSIPGLNFTQTFEFYAQSYIPLPTERYHHCAVTLAGSVYVMGGIVGRADTGFEQGNPRPRQIKFKLLFHLFVTFCITSSLEP